MSGNFQESIFLPGKVLENMGFHYGNLYKYIIKKKSGIFRLPDIYFCRAFTADSVRKRHLEFSEFKYIFFYFNDNMNLMCIFL